MVNLIITTSWVITPTLMPVIEKFSEVEAFSWLIHDIAPAPSIPKHAPILSQLEALKIKGQLTFLIAPDNFKTTQYDSDRGIIRILERNSQYLPNETTAVFIDSFSQLELLLSIHQYSGLSRLLDCLNWSAEDFRKATLDHYAHSLKILQTTHRAVIFGTQRLGELVLEGLQSTGINVEVFIDNATPKHNSQINGIPVHPLSALLDHDVPIVIATTRFSHSIACQLKRAGFKHILPYSVMSLVDAINYPDEIPYIGIQQDLANHAMEYLELFLTLSDSKSRLVLDGLLNYRMDYDTRFAESVSDECNRQYFDAELVTFSDDDVFIDLGGYDGDTVEKFIQFSNTSYSKIYLFEPDENLLNLAINRLRDQKCIEFIHAGAYSKDGELKFSASGRTNGTISATGEIAIPVRKIDSVVNERPTLIKMDIEGAEEQALLGGKNLLQTTKPLLAIAAYHFASDLWRLVHVVREINPSYKFYLRHYSETGLESVIYACCEQASNF